jgi:hypothetical protein
VLLSTSESGARWAWGGELRPVADHAAAEIEHVIAATGQYLIMAG